MFLIIIFILISIAFAWLINRWNFRTSIKLAYQIPSNRWHTFFGWGKIINPKNSIQCLYNYVIKHGPNSLFWLGPIPLFLTTDPNTIKNVFMSKNCINKPSLFMHGMTLAAGLGLISSNEPWWSRPRKVLNKAFSHKNLLSFLPIFNQKANQMIEIMDTRMEKGEQIKLINLFEQLTLNSSAATILKRDMDPQKFDLAYMTQYLSSIEEYVAEACIRIYYKIYFIFKLGEITKFRESVKGVALYREFINESWNILKTNNRRDSKDIPEIKSVLDYALNGVNENLLKEEEISGTMIQLFFGAFDTTAHTLYYILLMLAMHPEYQERLYEEILSIIPDNNDNDLTWDQLNQFTYLEMVMNETMRVTPAVPVVVRQVCNENLKLDNGITLPVGQCVVIDIFDVHRSKEIWGPQAHIFNPDNFLPSNVAARHPFSFIPFTKGLRFCIGWKYATLSAKIVLIKILKRYKFSTDFKYDDLKFQNHIVLKLVEEPQLHMQRREFS